MNEIEQKEIEEMGKVIESTEFEWYVQEGTSIQDWVKMHAENLYNAGYRNCKDKVVLSKEEFDKLGLVVETVQEYESDEKGQLILVKEQKIVKKLRTDFTELLNQEIRELQLAQVRQETAREILQTIKSYDGWNELQRLRDEIAEEYGVEVE